MADSAPQTMISERTKQEFINHFSNAQIYVSNKKYEQALDELKLAVEFDPENLKPYLLTLEIFTSLHNYKNVINVCNYILKKDSDNTDIKTRLAWGYYQVGNFDISKTIVEEILSVNANNLSAKEILADCKYQKGAFEDAKNMYIDLFDKVRAPERLMFKLSACYYQLKDTNNLGKITKKLLDMGYQDKKVKKLYDLAIAEKKSLFFKNKKDLTILQRVAAWLADPWITETFDFDRVIDQQIHIKETERRLDDTTRRVYTDELTQINNRAFFEEMVKPLLDKVPTTLVHFDIDKFKNVNDKLGHDAGDVVLIAFASIGKKFFKQNHEGREYQTFCRFGGEEFLAVVFGPKEKGFELAESFRVHVQDTLFPRLKEKIPNHASLSEFTQITCSGGLAELPKEAKDFAEAYKLADTRLYKAKEGGRNRLVAE